ncbi:MAG: TIM barrel protein, partial [Treponema sp.]|nr:TIM barrel protein [Treponema sp.]
IVEVEFKDTRPGQVRDIFFGEGTLDFDACFKMLNEIGYQGFLAAEMWYHEDAPTQPDIFKAREFLKNKMADY